MFKVAGLRSLNLIKVLSALRTKALRSGIWFTSLSHEDRVLAGLIYKNIKIVKNATLAVVIARIMSKLLTALKKSTFLSKIEMLGRPIAQSVSEKAYLMGNENAQSWASDANFIRYLGTMAYLSNQGNSLLIHVAQRNSKPERNNK